ncbi:hypothetical protein IX51_11580 [uncultured archaeon]|nr:hypothetical protein IX51_11580 [uncultured archaeon]
MISDRERAQIEKTVAKYYDYRKVSADGNSITFIIEDLNSYLEDDFNHLVDELATIDFVCFTSSSERNQITVIRSIGSRNQNYLLRVILLVASLGSVVYVGYSYVRGYTGSNSLPYVLFSSLINFTLPLFLIFLSRELTKFFVMAKNGMKYSLPVFVPDPLGLGTMGFINTPRQAFKTRHSMIETGAASLIAGFASSIVVIFIGNFNSIINPPTSPNINSPVELLSSPLIFQLLFNRVMPSHGILDPIAFAGWIGIVVNSFNAFPAGYLDGGLIATALFGNRSVYLSYASIIAIIGLGIIYPPWVLLAVFVVLLGMKGPEPLNNVSKVLAPGKALAVIAFAILILGMVPFPYHIVNSDFTVQIENPDAVIVNGTHENVTLMVHLVNSGQSSIVPAFSISPATSLKVQGPSKTIAKGENATYMLTIPFYNVNKTGMYDYSITTYSGEISKTYPVKIMLIDLSGILSVNNENPFSTTIFENQTYNFTEYNTGLSTLHLNVISFSDPGIKYSLTGSNLTIPLGQSQEAAFPLSVKAGKSMVLSITPTLGNGTITVVTYDANYSAAIAHIIVKNGSSAGSKLAQNLQAPPERLINNRAFTGVS